MTNHAAALAATAIIPDTHNCKMPEDLSVVMQPDPALKKTLVERFARGQLQPLDFILDH